MIGKVVPRVMDGPVIQRDLTNPVFFELTTPNDFGFYRPYTLSGWEYACDCRRCMRVPAGTFNSTAPDAHPQLRGRNWATLPSLFYGALEMASTTGFSPWTRHSGRQNTDANFFPVCPNRNEQGDCKKSCPLCNGNGHYPGYEDLVANGARFRGDYTRWFEGVGANAISVVDQGGGFAVAVIKGESKNGIAWEALMMPLGSVGGARP